MGVVHTCFFWFSVTIITFNFDLGNSLEFLFAKICCARFRSLFHQLMPAFPLIYTSSFFITREKKKKKNDRRKFEREFDEKTFPTKQWFEVNPSVKGREREGERKNGILSASSFPQFFVEFFFFLLLLYVMLFVNNLLSSTPYLT